MTASMPSSLQVAENGGGLSEMRPQMIERM